MRAVRTTLLAILVAACSAEDPPAPGNSGSAAAPGQAPSGGAGAAPGGVAGVAPSGVAGSSAADTTEPAAPGQTGGGAASTTDPAAAPAGASATNPGAADPASSAAADAPNAGSNQQTTTTVATDTGSFVAEDGDILIVEGTQATDSADRPINLGTETTCDGVDDNNNGIVDDVDVGKDGLCDCINMGFFGQISSDAGGETTAFEAWLVERSGEVPVKHLDADDTLTADWLASLQVLIIGGLQDRGHSFSAEEIAAFDSWLQERGAGVITLNGYTAEAVDGEHINELLVNTGMGYDFGGIPEQGIIGDGEAPPVWLTDIAAPDHPTVDGVNQIGVFYGYPVEGDGTVVLRGEGFDLAMAKEVGNGRAFVFADEWITQDVTWAGTVNGQADPCQQPCNEQENICRIALEQCERCDNEPCSDPAETDAATCSKGCQPSCESESQRCETNTQLCTACSAEADARAEATPRLWLNTIRWLTPTNECKVDIPPVVRVR